MRKPESKFETSEIKEMLIRGEGLRYCNTTVDRKWLKPFPWELNNRGRKKATKGETDELGDV